MFYKIILTFLIMCFSLTSVYASNIEKKQKPAYQLLEVLKIESQMEKSVMEMYQIQLYYNPFLSEYAEILKTYIEDQMGYDNLKEELAKMYSDKFSDEELVTMVKFYSSEAGQKSLVHMEAILNQASRIGENRVTENLPELFEKLDEAEKLQKFGQLAKNQ